MKDKLLKILNYKDKPNELAWDSFFLGVWASFLVHDIGRGFWVVAGFDLILLAWFYKNVKSTIAQVRAENGTPTN